jgi:pyridoxamine 5'-phosphate oxidase
MDLSGMRKDYILHNLNEEETNADALSQFKTWFQEALNAKVNEPNAMTLATSTPDGKPSARIVLLKGVTDDGFVFFTNYESAKGLEIEQNPHVALVFFWRELERQVRIEGVAGKTSPEVSEQYFHSRPFKSQVSAIVSPQSKIIKNKSELMEEVKRMEEKFESGIVPLPGYWGGYIVKPSAIEFWQGRENRFHDRIKYIRKDSGWERFRLAP